MTSIIPPKAPFSPILLEYVLYDYKKISALKYSKHSIIIF